MCNENNGGQLNWNMVTFKYADEKDRAYGLGGMAACLVLMEDEGFIDSISLDAEADFGLTLSTDFFYMPNPNLSAKSVWKENINHFELLAGMLVSNVLSRALVRKHSEVSRELCELILSRLKEEGREACSLDEDEVRDIFYKNYSFFHRVFSHDRVNSLMDDFVSELMEKRKMDKEAVLHSFRDLLRR